MNEVELSVGLLLKRAAEKEMKFSHFVIKSDLYGDLEDESYMVQPQGFVKDPGLVCKLTV